MRLQVLTMVDEVSDRMSNLRDSCKAHGLDLKILERNPWVRNAFKLRLLHEYLLSTSLDPEDVIMVVDAYDVLITGSESEILDSYKQFDSDIVFSAEANYYFREPDLTLFYWIYYPRNEQSVFQYLNSGSFIGKVSSLTGLMNKIAQHFGIDFSDDDQLDKVRSDQYVFSRFYVDYSRKMVSADFSLSLDFQQELFGCSGGRMSVINWKPLHWIQDYLFFKYERRWLKTFWMKGGQTKSRDFIYDPSRKRYVNKMTDTSPLILHLPGTYKNFAKALERISGQSLIDKWIFLFPLSGLVSLIAYVRSIVNYLFIKFRNKGRVKLHEVFPGASGSGEITNEGAMKRRVLLEMKNPNTPAILSSLRDKRTAILVDKEVNLEAIEKLGIAPGGVFQVQGDEPFSDSIDEYDVILNFAQPFLADNFPGNCQVLEPDKNLKGILLDRKIENGFPSDNPFTS